MAFPLKGKVDCIVGKDRRIVQPGTLVHFPPYARHGFKANEDGDARMSAERSGAWRPGTSSTCREEQRTGGGSE